MSWVKLAEIADKHMFLSGFAVGVLFVICIVVVIHDRA